MIQSHTLHLVVPTANICPIGCKYCISNMSEWVKVDIDFQMRNIFLARSLAKRAGVQETVVISRNEPVQNIPLVFRFGILFGGYFPTTLQTNARAWFGADAIINPKDTISKLEKGHYATLALSIDSVEILNHVMNCKTLQQSPLTIRYVFVLTNDIVHYLKSANILNLLKHPVIEQATFRVIDIPQKVNTSGRAKKTQQWIKENTDAEAANGMINFIHAKLNQTNAPFYGNVGSTIIFSYGNTKIALAKECIEEGSYNDSVRSLIYAEDGHMYTRWNDKGSRIF